MHRKCNSIVFAGFALFCPSQTQPPILSNNKQKRWRRRRSCMAPIQFYAHLIFKVKLPANPILSYIQFSECLWHTLPEEEDALALALFYGSSLFANLSPSSQGFLWELSWRTRTQKCAALLTWYLKIWGRAERKKKSSLLSSQLSWHLTSHILHIHIKKLCNSLLHMMYHRKYG